MKFAETRVNNILREHGYKLTPQRRQVIKAISLNHEHRTPAAIYELVNHQYPGIGRVTIYRTLEILTRLGLICEVHTEGSCHSYLLKGNSEHHHHLLCSECGTVVDFTDCELIGLEHRLSQRTGFTIDGHLLEFSGLCPECQRSNAA
jgi:Fur family ferric uptake transcriptional regulator